MIPIKTQDEIERMREGGRRLTGVMEKVLERVRPGVSLSELDSLAESFIKKAGGKPSFKMVPGYHWATCININQGVVHGIPGDDRIKSGDVVSVDMGMFRQGFHTDMTRTVFTSQESKSSLRHLRGGRMHSSQVNKFLQVGKLALKKATKAARLGNRVGHISQAIEQEIKKAGLSPIQSLTGHGVGKKLHEDPQIACFLKGKPEETAKLRAGMTLAIEVIYSQGGSEVVLSDNGWTIETRDGSLAGLFEDTVAVTPRGPLVLTNWR